ncbi:hypothetical protein [Streptomyces sp. L2]|uniref:hypothetical protein n=1 Tax=Streptomyces sp. L2 TaxID=2162665 RepID=UPI0010128D8B|nr:hypothetical protein [Streptomyces sp. L2]
MTAVALDLPAEVVDVLAVRLPQLDGLAVDRTRGRDCVWCGTPLNAETAVDLGERTSPLSGSSSICGMRWFPRACHACTARYARRALMDHSTTCTLCTTEDTAAACVVGRGLYRLQRRCRQPRSEPAG